MENVRATINNGLIIGTLSEKSTEIKQIEIEKEDKTKMTCNAIQGNIVISTKNGDYNLRISQPEYNRKGDKAKLYANMETLHNSYVSAADAAKNKDLTPDVISATVNLGCWDRYNQNSDKMVTSPQVRIIKVNRENADKESQTDFQLEGVIRSIVAETIPSKNENEEPEETGRYIVEFITVNYRGEAEPFTLIVPEDLAEAFIDGYVNEITGEQVPGYAPGDTCCLGVELNMHRVGGQKKSKGGFGRKANTNEGFEILELIVIGGEPAYDENTEDEKRKPFTPDVMKSLMVERDMKLKNIENEAKNNGSSAGAAPASKAGKSKGLGNRKPNVGSMSGMDGAPF